MYYKRLKDLRDDHDLMQKEIASILGIDQRVYSNYETGKREIPVSLLIKLAKYYSVSVDYLLGLTDNPLPYPKK
ncbi:MAG: helix-turn-helix transcriptional regulator [Clostridia bacterium]